LRFTGFGSSFSVGQNPRPTEPWPKVAIKSYEAMIDYDAAAMKVDMTRVQTPSSAARWRTAVHRRAAAGAGGQCDTAWNEAFGASSGWGRPVDRATPSPDGRLTIEQIFEVAGVRRGGPPPDGEEGAEAVAGAVGAVPLRRVPPVRCSRHQPRPSSGCCRSGRRRTVS
jgi:hypothetical protein